MRHLLIAAALLALGACAPDVRADETHLNGLRIAYGSVLALDWLQTRGQAMRGWNDGLHETNHLLGKHPSVQQIDAYFSATAAISMAASYIVEERLASSLLTIGTGFELSIVIENENKGGKISYGIGF